MVVINASIQADSVYSALTWVELIRTSDIFSSISFTLFRSFEYTTHLIAFHLNERPKRILRCTHGLTFAFRYRSNIDKLPFSPINKPPSIIVNQGPGPNHDKMLNIIWANSLVNQKHFALDKLAFTWTYRISNTGLGFEFLSSPS